MYWSGLFTTAEYSRPLHNVLLSREVRKYTLNYKYPPRRDHLFLVCVRVAYTSDRKASLILRGLNRCHRVSVGS